MCRVDIEKINAALQVLIDFDKLKIKEVEFYEEGRKIEAGLVYYKLGNL